MSRPWSLGDLRNLLWAGGEGASLPQMLAAGAAVWTVYCAALVAAFGVVLDEAIVPAQIITGAVSNLPGHPHQIFYPQAFSLPNYLWAALWRLLPDVLALSAMRNFIYIFVSVMVPFACGLLLTGRPVWGHLAAVLTVTEAALRIQGFYPLWVFPGFHSHGQIGLEIAALTAVLLMARCWGVGGFLLGLMPAIHASMSLILWPWSLVYFFLKCDRPQGRDRYKLLACICAGLLICAILALVVFTPARNAGPVPPYDVRADGGAVLRGFTDFSDYHRRPFPFRAPGYLLNLVAFCALGAILWQDVRSERAEGAAGISRHAVTGVLLFGAVAWTWVYASRFLHLMLGHFPPFLEVVMPYRFSNFSSVLLLPLTAAALAAALSAMSESLRACALALVTLCVAAVGILQACEGILLPPGRTAKLLLFFVWGLVFAIDLVAHWGHSRRKILSLAAAGALAASLFFASPGQLTGSAFIAGYVLAVAVLGLAARAYRASPLDAVRWKAVLQPALVAGLLLTSAGSLSRYRLQPERLTRLTPADRELKSWLDTHATPSEEVLTPPGAFPQLQTRTGHPVLMETETTYLITYMPRLAPVVGIMTRDLYGVDYSDRDQLRRLAIRGRVDLFAVCSQTWKSRTLADWQALARKYHFRLVLSLNAVPLQLPEAFHEGGWTLYTIPEGDASGKVDPSG